MFMRLRRVCYFFGISSSLFFRHDARRAAGLLLVVAIYAVSGLGHAYGTPISLGDFMGNTVSYLNVQEDSNSGDPPGLFGPASVSADSLDFNPVGFSANTSGLDVDQTD